MKKLSKTIAMLLLAVSCVCVLSACNKVDTSPDEAPETYRNPGGSGEIVNPEPVPL